MTPVNWPFDRLGRSWLAWPTGSVRIDLRESLSGNHRRSRLTRRPTRPGAPRQPTIRAAGRGDARGRVSRGEQRGRRPVLRVARVDFALQIDRNAAVLDQGLADQRVSMASRGGPARSHRGQFRKENRLEHTSPNAPSFRRHQRQMARSRRWCRQDFGAAAVAAPRVVGVAIGDRDPVASSVGIRLPGHLSTGVSASATAGIRTARPGDT